MGSQAKAREAVIVAGNLWRLRYISCVERDTPANRRALATAASRLDDAIAKQFETVYEAEYGRKGRQ
jgi:hypothetical protein